MENGARRLQVSHLPFDLTLIVKHEVSPDPSESTTGLKGLLAMLKPIFFKKNLWINVQ